MNIGNTIRRLRRSRAGKALVILALALSLLPLASAPSSAANPADLRPAEQEDISHLMAKAAEKGHVLVIAGLRLPKVFTPEGALASRAAIDEQRDKIATGRQALLDSLAGTNAEAYASWDSVPYVALKVDAKALQQLAASPHVTTIQEDVPVPPALASTTAHIGADLTWAAGFGGLGQTVVILDTGIDEDHPFFGGRLVTEACWSNAAGAGTGVSLCPGGGTTQTGLGSADATTAQCISGATNLCAHGSHVAGIAAGQDFPGGMGFNGVAPEASIIAIQIFTRFNAAADCAGAPPCVGSYPSDQLSGLNYINNTLRLNWDIASANMSLGGGYNTAACDADPLKAAIDNLRTNGIATVIASGNDNWTDALNAPGCISTAVTVGTVYDGNTCGTVDQVSHNMHQVVDLLAVGKCVDSSVPDDAWGLGWGGTSMATPQVTGAFAVLKAIDPSLTVTNIENLLEATGVLVTDTRAPNPAGDDAGHVKPRIQLDAAVLQVTEADLSIAKSDSPDPVMAGGELFYNITVTNNGPDTASDVVVTDTLPISVTYIADTAGCTRTPGPPDVLVCSLDDIAPGASRSFQIKVAVASNLVVATGGTAVIINTATVDSDQGDLNLANNTVTEGTFVEDLADLKITKVGKPDDEVRAGEDLVYTIFIDNLGPSDARSVVVTDDILSSGSYTLVTDPPAWNKTDPAGSGTCSVAGNTITCDLGNLAADGRATIEIIVTANETQDINNLASVTADTPDPDHSNNQAMVMTAVTDVADLELGKSAVGQFMDLAGVISEVPNKVTAGLQLTYTLLITNTGPSMAENVVIEDNLPAEVEVVSVSSSSGTCNAGTPGDPFDPTTCTFDTVPSGGTRRMDIVVRVKPDAPVDPVTGQAIIHNDARAFSDIFDPDNSDNLATNLTTVNARAELLISKSARGDNVTGYDPVTRQFTKTQLDNWVTAGELLQYTIVVTNDGPSDAQDVVVVDDLPTAAGPVATVHFVRADGAFCRQDPIDRDKITCDLDTLPAGESRTIYILVRVDPSAAGPTNTAVIGNSAEATSTTTDPHTPNIATNDTTVNAVADIFVTKVDVPAEPRLDETFEPDQAIAGKEHRYLITFGNNGPSVSRFVGVTDTLDFKQAGILGETFVRCEPLDPDDLVMCAFSAPNTVTVNRLQVGNEAIIPSAGNGTLNPGEQFGFYLITKVDPGYVLDADTTGTEPNLIAEDTAFISSTTTDHRTENNQDTEQTEIIAEADLKVTKTDTPDPGQNLYYDPVTNKFTYTYTISIENLGPSDAAKVVLTDTLPVDATFIMSETLNSQCYFRDDGILFCLVGNDPNNQGTLQAGRLNVGITSTVKIVVQADASAVDFLKNCVEVKAIAKAAFPFRPTDPIKPANFLDGRTPTSDPNLANNSFCETTTLKNPAVKVDKKVYVRRSPARGIDRTTDGKTEAQRCAAYATDDILTLPGDELTYCYTITNEGDTWLHSITLGDLSDALIYRAPTTNFTVVDPAQPPLRGTITLGGTGEAQTITIKTTEPAVAVLAPKGVPDDYDHILIIRSFTVDFPLLGAIAGIVWEDKNENHVVDLGETPGWPSKKVWLLNESGTVDLDVTTTDAEGRYAFHDVAPGRYKVLVREPAPINTILGTSPVIEFDPSKGYAIANLDYPSKLWYIESELYSEPIFRMLGTNTARVDARPSTKYSTPLPGIEASGDCDPKLALYVCDTDLLHDTLALPVLEDTTKEWAIYEDSDGDGLPSPGDVIEYTVDILNTGIIEATGVEYRDRLYNWINDNADDLKVPGWLINGSVSAAIHVYGREPFTGRIIDVDVQPPDLAFGEDLLLRTYAPAIGGGYLELTYRSAVVLASEILKGNKPGDDEVHVDTRLAIPPKGYLLRFDGLTYDPPIPVTFSLRIKYQVQIKETKYVRLGTIVLNHGWVTYNEMGLFDQRFPDFDPASAGAHTAANKVANNHAGTPGRAWEIPEFPGWPAIPADVEPTNYLGARFDEYPRPLLPFADLYDDDPTWFELVREPRRIQLPAIDREDGWETKIQVQNGGNDNTGAIVFFWGEYSGLCPSNDPGPVGHACKWIAENGLWSLEGQVIPSTAKSAIVYSVDEDTFDEACEAAAVESSAGWRHWEDDYEGTGEPIAVVVQREGPNDHGTLVSSAYPGISENNVGGGPEYQYFAPYAMRQYHNLDTEMTIHNSGQRCTQVWLDYQKQGDDVFSYSDHITQLAPGESIRKRVPAVLGAMWLGSIYVTADEPLGIVIDQTSFLPSDDQGTLLTYEARPYKLTTDTLFYADLVWRELSGWEASIQVQNLTQHSLPTFVTVEFFDASGDSILFLGEWVPRAGGKTFYLPAVTDLGMGYAGAAVIQSHQQVDYPGQHHPNGEPIFAVVDLKKTKMYDESLPGWRHTIAGEIQGGAYNALAEGEKKEASAVMLPFLAKAKNDQGVTSLMAIRNNSNCNQIELKLEVRKGTGTVVSYVHIFNLPPGHIKLIDLANVGSVNPGFVGAGAVRVLHVNQLCDVDNDGEKDETPTMLSVVVVNKGAGSGDITSVYEGIPVAYWGSP